MTTDTLKALFASATMKPKSKFLAPEKVAKEMKATLAKGSTKAKTAKTTASQQALAEKIKGLAKRKARLSAPSELARCRAVVGGDVLAGLLLYRMAYLYRTISPKMQRNGNEYLAMPRDDLAVSAGLSSSELKNRALPRLRTYASEIVRVEAMGNGKDKKLWFSVDLEAYRDALNEGGYEIKNAANEGVSESP